MHKYIYISFNKDKYFPVFYVSTFAKLIKKKKRKRKTRFTDRIGKRQIEEETEESRERKLVSSFKREWFVRQSSFSGLTRGGVFRGSCRATTFCTRVDPFSSNFLPPSSLFVSSTHGRRAERRAKRRPFEGAKWKAFEIRLFVSPGREILHTVCTVFGSSTFLATSLSRANLILRSFCSFCHLEFLPDGDSVRIVSSRPLRLFFITVQRKGRESMFRIGIWKRNSIDYYWEYSRERYLIVITNRCLFVWGWKLLLIANEIDLEALIDEIFEKIIINNNSLTVNACLEGKLLFMIIEGEIFRIHITNI